MKLRELAEKILEIQWGSKAISKTEAYNTVYTLLNDSLPKLENEKLHNEEAKEAFQKLCNLLLANSIIVGDWKTLVKILGDRLEHLERCYAPSSAWLTARKDDCQIQPVKQTKDKAGYVSDRLKALQRNSSSQVASNTFDELIPLMMMLAEDLSELKKNLTIALPLI